MLACVAYDIFEAKPANSVQTPLIYVGCRYY